MKVGTKAKFFHPRTMGVMHRGEVLKVHRDGTVTVRFDVTDHKGRRNFRTTADCICEE